MSQEMESHEYSVINSRYPFWDNSINGFCGMVNSMTMFDPFDLRSENKVYQRALQIMAKEILGWGLLWEEIVTTGDINAHVSIPEDQDEEIIKMIEDYLEEARGELV